MKAEEKATAIQLRLAGHTYSEIASEVNVSGATLSKWLRNIEVPAEYEQRVIDKKLAAGKAAGETNRQRRIAKTECIKQEGIQEAQSLCKDPFWMLGLALYWGEGDKPKPWRVGEDLRFSNMDPAMLRILMAWAIKYLNVPKDGFLFQLYLHETALDKKEECLKYWSAQLKVPTNQFSLIIKKSKITTDRKNRTDTYFGLVRIRIKRSTDLSRRVSGWLEGMIKCISAY